MTAKSRKAPPAPTPEDGMALLQRSYWLRKDDIISLDDLKNGALRFDDQLDNVDLSATLRGLIAYSLEVKSKGGKDWAHMVELIGQARNPKKRGPVPGSIN